MDSAEESVASYWPGSSTVGTDDIKALTNLLRCLVTDYLKRETCCDCILTTFRPGKLTSSSSLFFMVSWALTLQGMFIDTEEKCTVQFGLCLLFLRTVQKHISKVYFCEPSSFAPGRNQLTSNPGLNPYLAVWGPQLLSVHYSSGPQWNPTCCGMWLMFSWFCPFQLDPSVKVSLFLSLQGIWRIPVDEIDRPGSFASHMNRSIVLLLNVLSQLKDYNTLLKVSSMLQRTPDQGKYDRFLLSPYFVKLQVCLFAVWLFYLKLLFV